MGVRLGGSRIPSKTDTYILAFGYIAIIVVALLLIAWMS
jgi:hypothetical protein